MKRQIFILALIGFMQRTCLLIIVIIALMGCEKKHDLNETPDVYSESYVLYFVEVDSIFFEDQIIYNNAIGVAFKPKYEYPRMPDDSIMPDVEALVYEMRAAFRKEEEVRQDSLRNRFNDNTYNRLTSHFNQSIANVFTGIDIISDQDFNSFEAGASLKGITKLIGASPYKFIQSGYKKRFDWNLGTDIIPEDYKVGWGDRRILYDFGYFPVCNTLDRLTADDLMLLGGGMLHLRFTETPAIKEHNLTITFYASDTTISNTVDIVFPE